MKSANQKTKRNYGKLKKKSVAIYKNNNYKRSSVKGR